MSRAVDRITALLEVLATQARPSSLSEIADATGLDKSTVYRFLQACERQQIVRRDPETHRYSLGVRIIEWSGRAIDKIDVARIADPVLLRLNSETKETVALYMREGRQRTAVIVHNSPRTTVVARRLGSTAPLALGAAGKAILAHIPETDAIAILESEASLGQEMRERIRGELPAIRANGYATSMRELSDHAWSVASPVFGAGRKVVASIGISAPGSRHSERAMARFAELVVPAAYEVSAINGGVPASFRDGLAGMEASGVEDA